MARQLAEATEIARQAVSLLRDRIPVKGAYLFGSYSQGTAHDGSDIDLAAFSPAVDGMTVEEKMDLIARIQKQLGTEVEIHLFSERCLKEARPTNFYGHVLRTGIKIQ